MASRSRNKNRSLMLADRPGPLKREDILCPICWSILMEPVRLPCEHNLCLACYNKHVEQTSLQCPCCRMRLSVWSRKAARENSLVDQKLWTRIQKEFPKLVQTRMLGEDSQDLCADDLRSVFDQETKTIKSTPIRVQVPSVATVSNGEDEDVDLNQSTTTATANVNGFPRDMEICMRNGEIREELEQLLKPHEIDLETKKMEDEKQSQELINKIRDEEDSQALLEESVLEEDVALAKKIEEEEKKQLSLIINTKRKLFAEPSPSASQSLSQPHSKRKSVFLFSPSSSATKPISAFFPATPSRRLPTASATSTATASVNSLSSSYPSPSILKPPNRRDDSDRVNESTERDIPTPDSIDLEVNSHFRPIRTAPKTPAKLGEPEPTIVKTTPIKWTSPLSADLADENQNLNASAPEPTKTEIQTTAAEDPNDKKDQPGQAQDKAALDDRDSQGQDEDSQDQNPPEEFMDSQKRLNWDDEYDFEFVPSPSALSEPDVDVGKVEAEVQSEPVNENENKPDVDIDAPFHSSDAGPDFPKLTPAADVAVTYQYGSCETKLPTLSLFTPSIGKSKKTKTQEKDKKGCSSSSGSGSGFSGVKRPADWSDDEEDMKFLNDEATNSPASQCSSIPMDLNEIARQEKEFERIRAKYLQVAEDRKLARKLHKEMNEVSPRVDNPYDLRRWFGGSNPRSSQSQSQNSASTSSSSATPTATATATANHTATTTTTTRRTRSSKTDI